MDVPDIVTERLGDERATTRVNVGGDDRVYVTAARTLVYRAGGFLSNASIEEFTHDADALDVSAARRQATFAFTYGEDVRGFTVPEERVEPILTGVLSGLLATTGVTAPEESIVETYCFDDRTLVVTDARVLVHGGEGVWSGQYREHAYGDVTDVRFEQGASTPVVLVLGDRQRRIETPAEQARTVHRTLERVVRAHREEGATGGTTGTKRTAVAPEDTAGPGATTEERPTPTAEGEEGKRAAAGGVERERGDDGATVEEPNPERATGSSGEPREVTGSESAGSGDSERRTGRGATTDATASTPEPAEPAAGRAGRTDGAGGEGTSTSQPESERNGSSARSNGSPEPTNETAGRSANAAAGTATEPGSTPAENPDSRSTTDEATTAGTSEDRGNSDTGSDGGAGTPNRAANADAGGGGTADTEPPNDLDRDALVAELEALNETVTHQLDLIERQHDRIERLSEALDTE